MREVDGRNGLEMFICIKTVNVSVWKGFLPLGSLRLGIFSSEGVRVWPLLAENEPQRI